MKLIDIDKLFDEYISEYVYSNIGKIKPEEIENKMKEVLAARGEQYVSAYVPEVAEHTAPQAEMHTQCI